MTPTNFSHIQSTSTLIVVFLRNFFVIGFSDSIRLCTAFPHSTSGTVLVYCIAYTCVRKQAGELDVDCVQKNQDIHNALWKGYKVNMALGLSPGCVAFAKAHVYA